MFNNKWLVTVYKFPKKKGIYKLIEFDNAFEMFKGLSEIKGRFGGIKRVKILRLRETASSNENIHPETMNILYPLLFREISKKRLKYNYHRHYGTKPKRCEVGVRPYNFFKRCVSTRLYTKKPWVGSI